MADEEPKHPIGEDLQKEIVSFKRDNLTQVEVREKQTLPDVATITAEKKAAKETEGQ